MMLIPSRTTFLSLVYTALILLSSSTTDARQPPTSFCKCICFQNSTIIPLNSPPSQSQPKPHTSSSVVSTSTSSPATSTAVAAFSLFSREDDRPSDKKHRSLTCNDCNRAFCLDYNLPICKNAKEEDVFTSCFQRDSLKDETVVLLFILLTSSLLSWAVLKPYVDRFRSSPSSSASINPASYSHLASDSSGGGILPTTRDDRGGQFETNDGMVTGGEQNQDRFQRQEVRSSRRADGGRESISRQGGLNS